MPGSLKPFCLSFVPLLPSLWNTSAAWMFWEEIAFHHRLFTPQHRLDWMQRHLWPQATFCQKADAGVGDTDVKEVTSSGRSPQHTSPGSALQARSWPSATLQLSWPRLRVAQDRGRLRRAGAGQSVVEVPCSTPHRPPSEGPHSCRRSCAASSLVGVTHWHKGSEVCWGISLLRRQGGGEDNRRCLSCGSTPGRSAQGPLASRLCPRRGGEDMMREGGARAGCYLPTWVLQRWAGSFIYYCR